MDVQESSKAQPNASVAPRPVDDSSSKDEGRPLEQTRTLSPVETNVSYKSDDSDGVIEWNARSILAAISLSFLYSGASLQFIAPALNAVETSAWLPVANTLAIAATAPYTGHLQDLFGKRYIAMIGSLTICVGIVLLGTAHSFGQGVAGMAIAGAGAGVGEVTGLAGICEVVPVKNRGYSVAFLTLSGILFAPYVFYCQLLGARDSWRWIAWISLSYNVVAGVGLYFFYHPRDHTCAEGFSYRKVLRHIDYLGGFLSIVGLTLFLVALQSGGYTHSWGSAYVLCCLLAGVILIGCWVVWEARFAPYPMVPAALFRGQRIVAFAYATVFIAGMFFYSILNFLPLAWSQVYSNDPVQVGLKGLAPVIGCGVGVFIYNAMLSVFKSHSRNFLVTGTVIMTVFGGLLAVMTPDNPKTTVVIATIASFGAGSMILPIITVVLLVAPDALLPTAAALGLAARTVGGSIGYSIYYNIFVTKLKSKLPTYVAAYAVEAGLPPANVKIFVGTLLTSPKDITTISGVTPQILAAAQLGIKWAYAVSLHYVWYTSIAFGVCAIICCLFLGCTAKYQTNRIAVAL